MPRCRARTPAHAGTRVRAGHGDPDRHINDDRPATGNNEPDGDYTAARRHRLRDSCTVGTRSSDGLNVVRSARIASVNLRLPPNPEGCGESEDDQAALRRIVESVLPRVGEAVRLVRRSARIGTWEPKPHDCHDNVSYWVSRNPRHKQVFGVVLFDLRELMGCIRMTAHSAVEDENGVLYDITPHGASQDYPFVRHVGTVEDFSILATVGSVDVPIRR